MISSAFSVLIKILSPLIKRQFDYVSSYKWLPILEWMASSQFVNAKTSYTFIFRLIWA